MHQGGHLVEATLGENLPLVKELIAHGANVNLQEESGATALIYSTSNGFEEDTKTLLAAGADKKLKDKDGKTALDCSR